jgi:acyl carrier protein
MTSPDQQSDVIDLVARERGLSHEEVQLSDRLLQDLGMDGDDAVDFFNSVHERFGTDLTHLHEHWSEHFGPEGFSCWNGLVIIPAAVIGGAVAGGAGLSTFWGIAITGALLAAWLWVTRRWRGPDGMVPVTVGEVVAAVEAGAWPSRSQT